MNQYTVKINEPFKVINLNADYAVPWKLKKDGEVIGVLVMRERGKMIRWFPPWCRVYKNTWLHYDPRMHKIASVYPPQSLSVFTEFNREKYVQEYLSEKKMSCEFHNVADLAMKE